MASTSNRCIECASGYILNSQNECLEEDGALANCVLALNSGEGC